MAVSSARLGKWHTFTFGTWLLMPFLPVILLAEDDLSADLPPAMKSSKAVPLAKIFHLPSRKREKGRK
jgi:hypothetical protein